MEMRAFGDLIRAAPIPHTRVTNITQPAISDHHPPLPRSETQLPAEPLVSMALTDGHVPTADFRLERTTGDPDEWKEETD